MPLYEYECRQCGAITDVRHGFDETVTTRCPACGGELGRRFSPAGIVFKGSGFYVTDSRKPGGAKPAGSESTSSGDGKSGDSAGSAAKTSGSAGKGEGTAA
jgi:putative FmdB family regulatory protein